ncbi:MAG TPA: Rieske 2Fe-2S domain-containing protein [Bdellovibrio sp.]|uniref:Rieske 2Fe-2S domain-containing protein n=1 Tax=Bdellovibrio sp. TaxID=28201 RepID=UPI002F13B9B2
MNLLFRATVESLKTGTNFVANNRIIIFKENDDQIYATKNRCKHSSGHFTPCDSSQKIVTCPFHGWKLDLQKMTYVNPAGGLEQMQLKVELRDTDVLIYDNELSSDTFFVQPRATERPDFKLEFLTHASVLFSTPELSIVTDPWLTGPAFLMGWWLKYAPPTDWLKKVCDVDYIYISHNHSDHLNIHTLREIFKAKPDVRFLIPPFEDQSVLTPLKELGFQNFIMPRFNEWHRLNDDTFIMILPDASGRDDSGLLIDYRGYKVLDVVDCPNINDGILPKVDVLFTPFASGASGYPVCWQDMYPAEKISNLVERNRKKVLALSLDIIEKTKPDIVVPFAGYFVEAYPGDSDIRALNKKNTPEEFRSTVEKKYNNTKVWCPTGGAIFSFKDKIEIKAGSSQPPEYDFEKYLGEIRAFNKKYRTSSGVDFLKSYFEWAGFCSDMLMNIILMNEDFSEEKEAYWIDLQNLNVDTNRPDIQRKQFSRLKIRDDMFYYVALRGLPWEELSIGFQTRLSRDPDVYEFDFWNHFQNKLPGTPFYKILNKKS